MSNATNTNTVTERGTAMPTRYWGRKLPADCTDWLEAKSKATANAQSEIVKNLIRKAIEEERAQ